MCICHRVVEAIFVEPLIFVGDVECRYYGYMIYNNIYIYIHDKTRYNYMLRVSSRFWMHLDWMIVNRTVTGSHVPHLHTYMCTYIYMYIKCIYVCIYIYIQYICIIYVHRFVDVFLDVSHLSLFGGPGTTSEVSGLSSCSSPQYQIHWRCWTTKFGAQWISMGYRF